MVSESKKRSWVVKCKNADAFDCKWNVRAAQSKEKDFWSIRTAEMHHSCLQSAIVQDHHQLDSSYVASHILHLIQADPTLKVSAIQAQITESVGFNISYKKAWHGKQKALSEVYGDWVGSYKELPRLLRAIEYWNPGTVYRFFTRPLVTETGMTVPDVSIFQRVFWSFAPCIIGFNHCLPVIQVDGTFLKGKYKGTLLVATAIDGNRQIMPLAFTIVESENTRSWSWFIQCLQMYVT
ncbi:hypothetical protein LINPERPRIM_LOCUS40482 [Linum perenne]